MKLKKLELESLCEGLLSECDRTGLPLETMAERVCADARMVERGVTLAGVLEAVRKHGVRKRWEKRRHEARVVREVDERLAVAEPVVEESAGELRADAGGLDLVRYLAGGLVGCESRSLVPAVAVVRPATWTGARGDAGKWVLQVRMGMERRRRWKYLITRALEPGQEVEQVKGAGQTGGVSWLCYAVIFRTGARIDHVEPEARVRQVVKPQTTAAKRKRGLVTSVVLERLQLAEKRLALEEIGAKHAAVMQTFFGRESGIKSGAELARLTGVTRQAVSARKLLIAEHYYEQTGGKAGFENLHSAQRHREKVNRKKGG